MKVIKADPLEWEDEKYVLILHPVKYVLNNSAHGFNT